MDIQLEVGQLVERSELLPWLLLGVDNFDDVKQGYTKCMK